MAMNDDEYGSDSKSLAINAFRCGDFTYDDETNDLEGLVGTQNPVQVQVLFPALN